MEKVHWHRAVKPCIGQRPDAGATTSFNLSPGVVAIHGDLLRTVRIKSFFEVMADA